MCCQNFLSPTRPGYSATLCQRLALLHLTHDVLGLETAGCFDRAVAIFFGFSRSINRNQHQVS